MFEYDEDIYNEIDDEETMTKIDELNKKQLKFSDEYNVALDIIEKIEDHKTKLQRLDILDAAYDKILEKLDIERMRVFKAGLEKMEKQKYLEYF